MKQLLILSGKGGTGKTTVASAFIKISQAKAYADCDVDAPNLHLVSSGFPTPETEDFFGLLVAEINPDLCVNCGTCAEHCRFGAIGIKNGKTIVNRFACEGCGVCAYLCAEKAVQMKPDAAGKLIFYQNNQSVFSTAQLNMGKGTSGMLVTKVKNKMKDTASPQTQLAIIDGSPGIGCPVIASLAGVDMVLIVAEPSISGISDMKRIITTASRFGVTIGVCVNKYDTNIENTEKIMAYCTTENLPFLGKIPYDDQAVKAINNGQSIVDIPCKSGLAVQDIFYSTKNLLGLTSPLNQ